MNRKYWQGFYKENNIKGHTSFAEWCLKHIPKQSNIIDLGCGNGRDSYYFAQNKHKVLGVDFAVCPKDSKGAIFMQVPMKDIFTRESVSSVIYSRFFLHSIPYTESVELLKWSKGLFMAEFRAKGDEPKLYPGHPRHFIDGNIFINHLTFFGFDILHFEKGRGLAKYKGEDPLIIRVVAKK